MARQNQEDAAGLAITDFIRRRSEAGQLVMAEHICSEFLRMGILTRKEDQLAEFEASLKETVEQNEELKEIVDGKGLAHYYSVRSMAETYAKILIRRGEDPLLLMTETVRENSDRYPRPVPLRMFEASPFGLTPGEISLCLSKMADQQEYQDIQQTTTSIGTVFLFSTLYLEPDYAAFLAEWIDVGQANNP
ncbi:MAG TPA: hypothetical protein VLZ10_05290 [Thermodesulfobacteriota bacterium]|nr:hypothetical protein [Thermodesulfobacteriota bacterium]